MHVWLVFSADSTALEVFTAAAMELDAMAQEHGCVLTGPPLNETFRLADPGVPRAALNEIPPDLLPIAVGLVHAFAPAARRNAIAAVRAQAAGASP